MTVNYGPWILDPNKHKTCDIYSWHEMFTAEECNKIINIGNSCDTNYGTAGDKLNLLYRKSKVSWIPIDNPDNHWIFQKATDIINYSNATYFDYDLHELESLQFTIYDETMSKYEKHLDCNLRTSYDRKLSFSVLLSDPKTFTGGDLVLHVSKDDTIIERKQGVAYFFPSFLLHEVTPVLSGSRISLVGWVTGPRFR